ncbi:MAG TPA: hypothetical protein VJ836_02370 [Candidatus Saccharimonadales bacterium]|nr:hypothetical protein [Candidatus Saccharimonadales bacterium]
MSITTPFETNLQEQYHYAVRTLSALDITTNYGTPVPDMAVIRHAINPAKMGWLEYRRSQGLRDELVIAPRVGHAALSVADLAQRADSDAVVHEYPWGHTVDPYYNNDHNGIFEGSWQVGFMLGDVQDPLCDKPANEWKEPGLVYTDTDLLAQQIAIRRECGLLGNALPGGVRPITPSLYIMLHALRRVRNLPIPDQETFTRFTQYRTVRLVGMNQWLPSAFTRNDHLVLGATTPNGKSDRNGTRRVLPVITY